MCAKSVLEYIKSPVANAELLLIIYATIVLGFGFHSHLYSSWYRDYTYLDKLNITSVKNLFEQCIYTISLRRPTNKSIQCPTIRRERKFVDVSSICLAISIVSFIVSSFSRIRSLEVLHGFYNCVLGMVLVSAGLEYCNSATAIKRAVKALKLKLEIVIPPSVVPEEQKLLHEEKILVGFFTILRGVFHICILIMMAWNNSKEKKTEKYGAHNRAKSYNEDHQ